MERTGERLDVRDGPPADLQPLRPAPGASATLRACLLSGGLSRRMGTDKALLPHHDGGSWLERTLRLLLALNIPVTLFSRHPQHLRLARGLALRLDTVSASAPPCRLGADGRGGDLPPTAAAGCAAAGSRPHPLDEPPRLMAIAEPEPWQGPLLALHRLMEHHPDQRLLLCPVDMPWLTPEVVRSLLQAADEQPQRIHLAHDSERLQPLLGIYPSPAVLRADLSAALHRGERRLQGWLAAQDCREVRLEPGALRNVNLPAELDPLGDDHGRHGS